MQAQPLTRTCPSRSPSCPHWTHLLHRDHRRLTSTPSSGASLGLPLHLHLIPRRGPTPWSRPSSLRMVRAALSLDLPRRPPSGCRPQGRQLQPPSRTRWALVHPHHRDGQRPCLRHTLMPSTSRCARHLPPTPSRLPRPHMCIRRRVGSLMPSHRRVPVLRATRLGTPQPPRHREPARVPAVAFTLSTASLLRTLVDLHSRRDQFSTLTPRPSTTRLAPYHSRVALDLLVALAQAAAAVACPSACHRVPLPLVEVASLELHRRLDLLLGHPPLRRRSPWSRPCPACRSRSSTRTP
jgi:hypothetical protein